MDGFSSTKPSDSQYLCSLLPLESRSPCSRTCLSYSSQVSTTRSTSNDPVILTPTTTPTMVDRGWMAPPLIHCVGKWQPLSVWPWRLPSVAMHRCVNAVHTIHRQQSHVCMLAGKPNAYCVLSLRGINRQIYAWIWLLFLFFFFVLPLVLVYFSDIYSVRWNISWHNLIVFIPPWRFSPFYHLKRYSLSVLL